MKFCWHKYKDVKTQTTRGVAFGFGSGAPPGMRLVQECIKCGKIRHINLNLSMPERFLTVERIWRD